MRQVSERVVSERQTEGKVAGRVPTGVAGAALFASALGVFLLGLLTFVSEVSEGFAAALNFYKPAGPLSGKTTLAVVGWLVAWGVLHGAWRGRDVKFPAVFAASLVLVGLGLLLMFPPFFEIFAG